MREEDGIRNVNASGRLMFDWPDGGFDESVQPSEQLDIPLCLSVGPFVPSVWRKEGKGELKAQAARPRPPD